MAYRRQDGRYQTPTSLDVLRADNWAYLCQKLTARQAGEHSHALLAELVLGRVQCKAPPGWPPLHASCQGCDRLVDPPPGDIFVAASFAIVQEDEAGGVKLRRKEDWRPP